MRLFVDTANLAEINQAVDRGITGITTNPTLVAREQQSPRVLLNMIVNLAVQLGPDAHVSVEAVGTSYDELRTDAIRLRDDYARRVTVKLPATWDGYRIIHHLGTSVSTNCTACMSYTQVAMGVNAGATFVSLFWNRIRDGGEDPASIVRAVRETFDRDGIPTEIIVGSIRQPSDVAEAFHAGAHIVTVPPPILRQLCEHPKTDEVVAQFTADARGVLADGRR